MLHNYSMATFFNIKTEPDLSNQTLKIVSKVVVISVGMCTYNKLLFYFEITVIWWTDSQTMVFLDLLIKKLAKGLFILRRLKHTFSSSVLL